MIFVGDFLTKKKTLRIVLRITFKESLRSKLKSNGPLTIYAIYLLTKYNLEELFILVLLSCKNRRNLL